MTDIEVKICGITTVSNADIAEVGQADALGFNFYSKSKRYVDPEMAAKIVRFVGGRVSFVGVFVNASVDEIETIAKTAALSHVQLHGDEQPEMVAAIRARLPKAKLIRAVRIMDNDLKAAQTEIDAWQDAGADLILLDAASLDAYGGTGKQLDWSRLTTLEFCVPWLLAGGLDHENVAEAIGLAKPNGVDVASGVESSPGVKDKALVKGFTRTAKRKLHFLAD